MENLYLIKIGEISLKKGNRAKFEKQLRFNIKKKLNSSSRITIQRGRFFLESNEKDIENIRYALSTTPGLVGFSRAVKVNKDISEIKKAALVFAEELASRHQGGSFKIESRRADKGFEFSSYQISSLVGEYLLKKIPSLHVDVHKPDWIISIELRDLAYIYGAREKGAGGLPVGSAAKGMLLLSGGIDSPVAGYLMAKRGVKMDAVYFHAYPYTSDEALEKVKKLAQKISPYLSGVSLFVVPFTDFQLLLKEKAREEEITLLMRAGMVKIAEIISKKRGNICLITGESLSQVASQTVESIRYTGSETDLPVFRPLIGMDKEDIIKIAKNIETYDTSILPFEDCCTIFSPKHPQVKPELEKLKNSFLRLNGEDLLEEAAEKAERFYFKP
ncbi:MAG: tRNA 4-thiouridine(8) synthase ThiI [Spirochaetales bacterium]|nr:tRNA 4-thiouridine(8) synthase ThiI [Spirochaetales bacterium]